MLSPAFGVAFADLYQRAGLLRLDAAFLRELEQSDDILSQRLAQARADPFALSSKQESELLIALAPHLDDFIADLFGIKEEVMQLSARHQALVAVTVVGAAAKAELAANRTTPDRAP